MNVLKMTTTMALAVLTVLLVRCSEQHELNQVPTTTSDAKSPTDPEASARFSGEGGLTDVDVVHALGQYAQALNEDFSFENGEQLPVKTTLPNEDVKAVLTVLAEVEGVDQQVFEAVEVALAKQSAVFRLPEIFVPRLEAEIDLIYIPLPEEPEVPGLIIPVCLYYPWRCEWPPLRWCAMGQEFGWRCFCHYALCFDWLDLGCAYCFEPWYQIDYMLENFHEWELDIDHRRIEEAILAEELPKGPVTLGL